MLVVRSTTSFFLGYLLALCVSVTCVSVSLCFCFVVTKQKQGYSHYSHILSEVYLIGSYARYMYANLITFNLVLALCLAACQLYNTFIAQVRLSYYIQAS